MLRVAAWTLVVLFPVTEVALSLFKRSRAKAAAGRDRGSLLLLWAAVAAGVTAGLLARGIPAGWLRVPGGIVEPTALALMLSGLAVRWWAIAVLGPYFTTNVAVEECQPVIQGGPYRFVRHSSYVGLLLALAGIGVMMASWLSLVVLLVPAALATLHRIRVEERALLATLGLSYADYCGRTRRLIPGVF
ncbi:isoprenylcysteine carboxylmethyltransferase family protein [candidate division WOR-3 bacterium]|nr:isoprenylcysteine carboxylmethyltransferase family protein [candidate division WOR-3 bacterium]